MDDFRKQFAKNLKELRNFADITQEEMAEKLELSPKTVSYWENGHNCVTFETIPKLADALNIPIYRLFIFDNAKNTKNINDLFSILDEREQEIILSTIKLFLSRKK